jgi:hypothetical protein
MTTRQDRLDSHKVVATDDLALRLAAEGEQICSDQILISSDKEVTADSQASIPEGRMSVVNARIDDTDGDTGAKDTLVVQLV